jgi:hypothetical protein
MKPLHVAILAVVIVLFGIAAVTILVALDKSPAQLIGLLTAIAAPTITSLLAMVKVDAMATQIEDLRAEVRDSNGH